MDTRSTWAQDKHGDRIKRGIGSTRAWINMEMRYTQAQDKHGHRNGLKTGTGSGWE